MPEDTGFYIDDVCLPHTWFPVEADVNDKLIFKLIHETTRIATIPCGNYSVKDLGVAIATAMNASAGVEYFESEYLNTTSALKIQLKTAFASSPFTIYTDATFTSMALPYLGKALNSLLKNLTQKAFDTTSFLSGYVDIYPVRNIYMTSSGLGNFNTMSVAGDRNIIKKIPVNAGHGDVIFDQTVTGMDYSDCIHQTLSRISFQLKDIFGKTINLHGNYMSFSIVFARVQDGT